MARVDLEESRRDEQYSLVLHILFDSQRQQARPRKEDQRKRLAAAEKDFNSLVCQQTNLDAAARTRHVRVFVGISGVGSLFWQTKGFPTSIALVCPLETKTAQTETRFDMSRVVRDLLRQNPSSGTDFKIATAPCAFFSVDPAHKPLSLLPLPRIAARALLERRHGGMGSSPSRCEPKRFSRSGAARSANPVQAFLDPAPTSGCGCQNPGKLR